MDMQKMLQQAQKLQKDLEKIKAEAEHEEITAESGGGMVKVIMKGNNQISSIKISPDAVDSEDLEMLEDLIIAAVNKATKDAKAMVEDKMSGAMGPLGNIPGMGI